MSDHSVPPNVARAAPPTTAGGLLRQARQAQGIHIAALAAAIKVVPRKLEFLESDQYDKLPDNTFARALAQTVCRSLKIDAAPVLALLPPLPGQRLEHVAQGLNAPFRDRPGLLVPREWASVASPALWFAGLLLLAAAAVYLVPADWIRMPSFGRAGDGNGGLVTTPIANPMAETTAPGSVNGRAAPADIAGANAPGAAAPGVADAAGLPSANAGSATPTAGGGTAALTAGASSAAAASTLTAVPAATSVLQLHTTAPSWVTVTDSRGQALVSRMLKTGETLGIDAAPPFKLRIGNARVTQVVFRGEPFELAKHTKDNVARVQLK